MSSNKINTILFDYDGTIMNTNQVIIESWQYTFRTVEGKERSVDSIISTFGEPLFKTMAKQLPQITVEEGVKIYRSYMRDHYKDMITPFPGMVELIGKLKDRKYSLGLVTSRTGDTVYDGLEKYNLISYFDCIVSCDDTDKHKPDPEPLFIAMNKLSADPTESIMLGDSMFDIQCARNAGVKSVLVGWQISVPEEVINGPDRPDFTIIEPQDLFKIL